MKQKVCTTHELPEKEPGDMAGVSEVENNCWAPDRDHFLLLLCAVWKVAVVSSFTVGIGGVGDSIKQVVQPECGGVTNSKTPV